MPNRRNELSSWADDAALWREAVRSVAPLQGSRPQPAPAPTRADPRRGAVAAAGEPPRQPTSPALDPWAGIDRASAERLKRGLRPIEARLDLHGMTQGEAYRAVADFVRASSDAGRRCLLVITGRGIGTDGRGILRNSVPRWLEDEGLRRQVLAVAPAQPRHGGAGALYLLLRRRR
jgi:DNA-nicking Smr family endonuclease